MRRHLRLESTAKCSKGTHAFCNGSKAYFWSNDTVYNAARWAISSVVERTPDNCVVVLCLQAQILHILYNLSLCNQTQILWTRQYKVSPSSYCEVHVKAQTPTQNLGKQQHYHHMQEDQCLLISNFHSNIAKGSVSGNHIRSAIAALLQPDQSLVSHHHHCG